MTPSSDSFDQVVCGPGRCCERCSRLSFYIRTVGVRPAYQRQGLGSMLMQPTLERADAAGLPTYIEASSERSAALYERLGFRHLGAFELPDGGPLVWPILRAAAAG